METFFRTSWDRNIARTTVLFCLLVVGLPVAIIALYFLFRSLGAPQIPGAGYGVLALSLLMLAILLATIALAPRGYRLDPDAVRIVRFAPHIRVRYADITQVTLADGEAIFRNSVKIVSVKGAFGIYGRFFGSYFPEFQSYVTSTDRVVVIDRTHDIPLIISPEDPDMFLQLLQGHGVAVG